MLLLCKKCAYPNLPTNDICGRCGNMIQSPEELAKSTQAWKDLPEQVRMEFENKYRAAQVQSKKYRVSYKKRLAMNMLLCGVALGILTIFHNGSVIIPGVILGALIGWYLTVKEGGSFKGMMLFGAGYFISFIFHLIVGWIKNPFKGDFFGIIPIVVGGYLAFKIGQIIGERIASESFDQGM